MAIQLCIASAKVQRSVGLAYMYVFIMKSYTMYTKKSEKGKMWSKNK